MKFTRLGWGCLFLTGLTAMSATSTGNNLLYLLLGGLVAALGISALAGRMNLARLRVRAEWPGRIFRGEEFPVTLRARAQGLLSSHAIWIRGTRSRVFVETAPSEGSVETCLRVVLPQRGLNRVDDLYSESTFPFGLMAHRRVLQGLEALAFPRLLEIHSPAEIDADIQVAGIALPRKGMGEDLYGIRPMDPGDDVRAINWKLTAKAGKPLINEYCASQSSKMTIRVRSVGNGEEAERRLSSAASAVRYHLDAGSEVRLLTPEGEVGFGKGLIQLDRCLEALARMGEGKLARSTGDLPPVSAPAIADTTSLRRLLFALMMLVAASLYLVDEINAKALSYFLPIIPIGWLLYEFKGPRLPQWLWDAASIIVLAYLLILDWRISGVVIANTHLIAYLLANRSLAEIKERELPQTFLIVFLAFFLVSGLSISPWYFLAFLLYAILAAAWLMTSLGLTWRQGRRWVGSYGLHLAGALACMALFFVLVPRVDRFRRLNPFVAMGIDKLQVKSSSSIGFSEGVRLGFFGTLKRSTARVMRVKPDAVAGKGKPASLRIRGTAYDRFDGRSWSRTSQEFGFSHEGRDYRSVKDRAWALREGERTVLPGMTGGAEGPGMEFLFYPINLAVLFTVGGAWAVEGTPQAVYFDFTDSVYFAAPYIGGIRYKLRWRPETLGFAPSISGYDRILRERFLQLPENLDPRIKELAGAMTRGAKDDWAKAKAIEAALLRNYSYSNFSEVDDRDLSDFLFSSKKGNCEYFATAAAVLLRASGVPARIATGFVADDFNEYGKFYDVRQGQAHAWTEVYVRGRGWLTLEPTPSPGFFIPDVWSRRVERLMDAAEMNWYRYVIGYDQYAQRNTFYRLGMSLSPEKLWKTLKPLLSAALLSAAAAGLFWLARRAYIRRRVARGFYLKAEEALARAGLGRAAYFTPREYAGEIVRRRPALKKFSDLVELHYLERYAPQGLSEAQKREADRLLGELSRHL